MKKRMVWIDAIRVLCVLYIAGFWHMGPYLQDAQLFNSIRNTHTASTIIYCILAMFTMLSGFFSLNGDFDSMHGILSFYKKKLLRIYPLFTLAGLCFVFCHYNSFSVFIRSELLIGLFHQPYPLTLWFVGMLLVDWLLTPLVVRKYSFHRSLFTALFIELLFLVLSYAGIDPRLYQYWPFFYLGILIRKYDGISFLQKNRVITLLSFVLFIIFDVLIGKGYTVLRLPCALTFIYCVSAAAYMLFGQQEDNRVIQTLSYAGMCAYMFHRPFYYLIVYLFGKMSLMGYIVSLPGVFLMGYVIQKGYDTGLKKLGH